MKLIVRLLWYLIQRDNNLTDSPSLSEYYKLEQDVEDYLKEN